MTTVILALALVLFWSPETGTQAGPNDWPQWRGPARTAVIGPDAAPAAWPSELKKGWSLDVGEGYSSPVVLGGRAFVHARRDPEEVVSAIDLATGKVLWERRYQAPFAKNPYAKEMAKGPYATPLAAGSRLFTLGTSGILSAWNVADGTLLWRKDYSAKIDTSKLFCGTASSPMQTDQGILVHVGDDRSGLIATFDPATGKEVWARTVDGPGYASPIRIDVEGTAQIVTMTTRSVAGIAATNGEVLWEFPYPDEWNENIVTPVAVPGGVIVSGVRQGTRRLAVTKTGTAWSVKEAWHSPDVTMYMSSPVLVSDTLYAHSSKRRGQFVALDPSSGALRWATAGRDGRSASIVAAGDHLLVLTTESQLIVARADPAAFREVRRYTVADAETYSHPAILRDRLLVRDATRLTEWRW
jgi:outer membrane protein assembly factor BamB